jgi:hypothetical protein
MHTWANEVECAWLNIVDLNDHIAQEELRAAVEKAAEAEVRAQEAELRAKELKVTD